MHLADGRHSKGRLDRVYGMSAEHKTPRARRHLRGAPENFSEHLEWDPFAGPAHQVQAEERAAAHGVDVADRVGRRDAAPHARVVVDGGDEVGGDDQGAVVVQPPDRGVVARGRAHEQVGMTRKLKAAQNLRQLAGGELAASPRAVAELGQSSCLGVHADKRRGMAAAAYRSRLPIMGSG